MKPEMTIEVKILYDAVAHVWIAENEVVGLILESDSYDKLVERVRIALPELIELNNINGYNEVEYDTLPYREALVL